MRKATKAKTATQGRKRSAGTKAKGTTRKAGGMKAKGRVTAKTSARKATGKSTTRKAKGKGTARSQAQSRTKTMSQRSSTKGRATPRGRKNADTTTRREPIALGGIQHSAVADREETRGRPFESRDAFRSGSGGAQGQNDVVAARNRRPQRYSRGQVGARHH